MYCNNCGTQYDDGQAFCPNCGTPAESPAPAASPLQTPSNEDLKKKLPLIVGAGVVLLIVLIVLISALSGGYKKAVKNSLKYAKNGKSEKLLKISYPKSVYEEMLDDKYDMDADEFCEAYDAAFDALWDGLKDEGKVKFTYEIKEVEKIGKLKKLKNEFSKMDIDDFQDVMDTLYDDYGLDADKIKTAYAFEIKWKLEVDGDKAASDTLYTVAYKYKGKWYVTDVLWADDIAGELDSKDFKDVIEDVYDELEDVSSGYWW